MPANTVLTNGLNTGLETDPGYSRDLFDETSRTTLGANWTVTSISAGNFVISTTDATMDTSANGTARYEVSTQSQDHWAEIVTVEGTVDSTNTWGVNVRFDDTANTSYRFQSRKTGSAGIYKVVDGTATILFNLDTISVPVGTRMRLDVVGGLLTAFLNNVSVGSVTDPNPLNGTKTGLYLSHGGANRTRIEQFEQGPIGAAAPSNPTVSATSSSEGTLTATFQQNVTLSASSSSEGSLTTTFFASPGVIASGSSTGNLTNTLSATQTVSAVGSSEGTLSATVSQTGGTESYTVSATGLSTGTLTTAFVPLLVVAAESTSLGTLTAILSPKYFFISDSTSEGVLSSSISGRFTFTSTGTSTGTLTTVATVKGEGGSGPAPSFVLINNRLRLIF